MRKRSSFCLLLVLSVCMLQAQRISKKIVLNKGQKLESVVNTTMTMSQEMMGQQVDVKSDITTTSLIEIKNITDESFILDNTLERMVMHTTAMGQDNNFDSDKPEDMEGQLGASVKGKIGVAQEMVISKQGRIMELKDTGSTSDIMASFGGAAMSIGTPLGVLSVLPDRVIKPGDTWMDSTGTPETVKLVNSYTLRKVSGNEATVDITGSMAKAGMIEQQGMQVTMNIHGTTKGESVFELNTGILKTNSTSGNFSGTVEVMGQSVPLTANTVVTTKVNKL